MNLQPGPSVRKKRRTWRRSVSGQNWFVSCYSNTDSWQSKRWYAILRFILHVVRIRRQKKEWYISLTCGGSYIPLSHTPWLINHCLPEPNITLSYRQKYSLVYKKKKDHGDKLSERPLTKPDYGPRFSRPIRTTKRMYLPSHGLSVNFLGKIRNRTILETFYI